MLIFDMAGVTYGPTKGLTDEERSRLVSALERFKDERKVLAGAISEKFGACLTGGAVAPEQIGLVSSYQFVDGRASDAMEEELRVLYANQLPLIGWVRDHIPAVPERDELEEFIEGLHRKYALKVP